jgi:hypothetical protein
MENPKERDHLENLDVFAGKGKSRSVLVHIMVVYGRRRREWKTSGPDRFTPVTISKGAGYPLNH